MPRKMIAIDEEEYRELVRAKGKMEMESGRDMTLGEAVAIAAAGILTGWALSKLLDEIDGEGE
jgi:hypothetical protein